MCAYGTINNRGLLPVLPYPAPPARSLPSDTHTWPSPPARSLPSDLHLEEGGDAPPGCPPLPRRPQFPPADVLAALQPALPPGMGQEQGGALLTSWAFLHAFGPMLGLREVTVSWGAAGRAGWVFRRPPCMPLGAGLRRPPVLQNCQEGTPPPALSRARFQGLDGRSLL